MHRTQVFNLATLFCVCLVSNQVQAQDASIPPLQKGQLVYTIPSTFIPPSIGTAGIKEIQISLSKLHHPYYVVIMDNLPPGSGTDDDRAAKTVNDLARVWATSSSNIFTSTSSIFLLSHRPRKYRFIAGARWTNDLGFANEAHKPYTTLFESSVKMTPPDAVGGIIKMANAVDDYVFDATDPERIKRRNDEKARAQAAQKLSAARETLRLETKRLQDLLLHTDANFLADTIDADRAELVKASRQLDNATAELDPNKLQIATQNLKAHTDALEQEIQKKESAASWEKAIFTLKVLSSVSLIALMLYLLNRRQNRAATAKRQLKDELDAWKEKIGTAELRYGSFQEREGIIGMGQLKGESAALHAEVTTEVDRIFICVQALKQHLLDIAKRGNKGGFFRPEITEKALSDLSAPFSFDTESIDQNLLFGNPQGLTQIDPTTFSRTLEKRFTAAMQGWKRLTDAHQSQLTEPEQRFPKSAVIQLEELMRQHEIPPVWLKSHPLANPGSRDQVYADLAQLQLTDPIAYDKRIIDLKAAEAKTEKLVHELIGIIDPVTNARPKTLKLPEGTIVDDDDHPDKFLSQGDAAQVELAGMLASEKPIETIATQAKKTIEFYNKALDQAERIMFAVQKAQSAISGAMSAQSTAAKRRVDAEQAVSQAQVHHLRVNTQSSFTEGDLQMGKGESFLTKAKTALEAKRHLEARRHADEARARFEAADKQFAEAINRCNELENARARFETNSRAADDIRHRAESRIRNSGKSASLETYRAPPIQGAADYFALNTAFDQTTQSWEHQAREAEDARRRADDAARAAAAAQAAAESAAREQARRRAEASSYASSSSGYSSSSNSGSSYSGSSSGNSYGGGGDSSSGGSFGGGGDSSSGGDWLHTNLFKNPLLSRFFCYNKKSRSLAMRTGNPYG